MPDIEKIPVGGSVLALLHLMAEKGLISKEDDPGLDQNRGRLEISMDLNDKIATLFINEGKRGPSTDTAPRPMHLLTGD